MMSSVRAHTAFAEPMFRTEMRGDVLLAVIDMPGRSVNVFSWDLMDQTEGLITRIENDAAVKALVLTSGKASFLAGADLDMVRGFTEAGKTSTHAHLFDMCGRLGRIFVRLEALSKPCVAAINGLALGGGLEVSMACHYRIVADDPRIQLGLPEIKLGLLPGAGGTQRLPRLVGIEKGLELLLNGKSVAPAQARALGLVDEVVPGAALIDRAVAIAHELARKPAGPHYPARLDPGPFDVDAPDAVLRIARHYGYSDDVTAKYPAYQAIIRATLEGADMPIEQGDANEMERFIDLMRNEVAGNMVTTLFLERQKADKLVLQFKGLKNARFAVVAEGVAADALRAGLMASRAILIDASQATAGDVVIALAAGPASARAGLRTDLVLIESAEDRLGGEIGVFVRRSAEYGTAIEIVNSAGDSAGVDAALALARQLRATPYLHDAMQSLLAKLTDIEVRAKSAGLPEEARIAAQALAAGKLDASGAIGDTALADVACVVSGVFPPHAGGPFTYLARNGASRLAEIRARYVPGASEIFA